MKKKNVLIGVFTTLAMGVLYYFLIQLPFKPFQTSIVKVVAETQEMPQDVTSTAKPNKVQIALILDTSSSMDGLIEQAKSQLWKMVNNLSKASSNGVQPDLEIALFEYGKSSLSYESGYVRNISALSTDLDLISKELFSLKTNGGSEYCGKAILEAVDRLDWSENPEDLKVIFIAGNEPFDQGTWDYRISCSLAAANDIIVNTIFCGDQNEGIRTHWMQGATLASGNFMNIDHNERTVFFEAPQDQQIADLNYQLNNTYIHYGSDGQSKKKLQLEQDSNAMFYGLAGNTSRVMTKANGYYKNESWDLIDATNAKNAQTFEWSTLDNSSLPEALVDFSEEEIKEYVEEKRDERKKLKNRINNLYLEREEFVIEKRSELNQEDMLDVKMMETIKTQAEAKNFKFKK